MAVPEQIKDLVRDYVKTNKGWSDEAYQIDPNVAAGPQETVLVTVIHRDDIRNPRPGGGKSIQLRIDLKRSMVVQELAFQ